MAQSAFTSLLLGSHSQRHCSYRHLSVLVHIFVLVVGNFSQAFQKLVRAGNKTKAVAVTLVGICPRALVSCSDFSL